MKLFKVSPRRIAVAVVAVSQPAPELDGAGRLPAPELVPDANLKAER